MFKQGFGILSLVFYCLFLAATNASANHDPSASHQKMAYEKISSGPLNFTKNIGQWPDEILYRANAGGATMWFSKTGTYYQFSRRTESNDMEIEDLPQSEIMMIKAEFIGSNPEPGAFGLRLMDYVCHFYFGRDSDSWYENVPNFESISLEDLYPGIDLTYYGNGHHLEYDFRVSPGADYSQIKIHYDGIENLSLSEDGALVIQTQWGELREIMPLVYQEEDGIKKEIQAEFEIGNNHSFGFKLGNDYNPELYAVIDPFLVYSSYLGGNSGDDDDLYAVDADNNGCLHVVGKTWSSNFPLYNPIMTWTGEGCGFISKFNADCTGLVYSTYIGSETWGGLTWGLQDIEIDNDGYAYVVSAGCDLPLLNPYETCTCNGSYAYVAKFNPSGTLNYGTCIGDEYDEEVNRMRGIAIDTSRNMYVAGYTVQDNFPTVNAYQDSLAGYYDCIVAKLSADGSTLLYSTYIGGPNGEQPVGIAVDEDGNAHITGYNHDGGYPLLNPLIDLPTFAHFITKLNPTGDALIYSTDFYSGEIHDIEVDENGNACVVGWTYYEDFPLVNPIHDTGSAIVTKISPDGLSLVYSTYFYNGRINDIEIDAEGYMYLVGRSGYSDTIPEINPYEWLYPQVNSKDYFSKLSPDGQNIIHFSHDMKFTDVQLAIDTLGNMYIAYETAADFYPVVNGFADPDPGMGNCDIWLAKFTEDFDGDGINNDGDESGAYGDYPCPDGIIDDCDDNCPDIPNADQADSDGDGAGNVCDNCIDIANPDQINSDDDEYGDECDNCPNDNNSDQADSDDDNVGNVCDNCPDVSNTNQTDTDEDEVGDACDNCPDDPNYNQNDGDNDTVGDICDNCPDDINTNQENSDGDTHGDACDNCPYDTNEDQADLDDDGIGDICDLDMDGDGIDQDGDQNGTPGDNPCTGGNVTDCDDNCPITYNPGQEDSDGDGIGDACAYVCGDANGDTNVNVSDAVWIINYVFIGGDPPDPLEAGDCNCDATCNVSDAVWIINYVFIGGDDPCDTDGDQIPDC